MRFFVAFLISLLAALGLGAGALYAFDREYTGRILPGVTVGGIDCRGLAPDEATAVLAKAFASFGEGRAVLAAAASRCRSTTPKIDRRPDVDGMVAEAMAVGRSGNTVERVILDARTAIRGVDIEPTRPVRRGTLARYVQTCGCRLIVDPQDAAVARRRTASSVVEGIEGQVGRRVGADGVPDCGARPGRRAERDPGRPRRRRRSSRRSRRPRRRQAKATADRIAVDVADRRRRGDRGRSRAATVRTWITFETKADGVYQPVVDPAGVDAALAAVAKEVDHGAR